MKKEAGIIILLVVVCTFTAVMNHKFLSPLNLHNLAMYVGQYGVFSIGLGLVIITGGIDLSVGSMLALAGVLLNMALRDWGWPWPVAAAFVLVVPMIAGWIHGWLITRLDLQPFIVTLCGLLIYRGLARTISHDEAKGFGAAAEFSALKNIAKGEIAGVPMPFIILLIIAVIAWLLLHRSVYGRYLLAVGKNEEAARFSGINTRRVITSSYVLAGLLTGVSAIMFAMSTNQVTPSTHGMIYEVYGIAACVLGGCSLRGGEGSIIGIIVGITLLQVLENLVNLLGIKSSSDWTVMGGVVLIGVIADQLLQRRAKKRLQHQPV